MSMLWAMLTMWRAAITADCATRPSLAMDSRACTNVSIRHALLMGLRSQQPNPWVGKTYIPDNTRMEIPPAWFLGAIHDQDAELVLLPSRQKPFAYVIARRLRSKVWSKAQVDSVTQPDTLMCMRYNLIPVCLMFKHGPSWSVNNVIRSLRARDMWAHGGPEKVADLLEGQEDAERKKIDREIRDDQWNRSGDAWRSYQARTGQRVTVPSANRGSAN